MACLALGCWGGTLDAGVGRRRTKTSPREMGRQEEGDHTSLSHGNLLTKYKFKDITKEFKEQNSKP